MKDDTLITLSGFGELEDEDGTDYRKNDLAKCAKEHGVEFYPTYYDHELKGKRGDIEKVTKELWGMPSDQWADNALTETAIIE